VLHSFGREDQLDRAAIERLVASLAELLDSGLPLSTRGRIHRSNFDLYGTV
jgi:hypothetical protein